MRTDKTAGSASSLTTSNAAAPKTPLASTVLQSSPAVNSAAMRSPGPATTDTLTVASINPGQRLARACGVKGSVGRPFERTLVVVAELDKAIRENTLEQKVSAGGPTTVRSKAFRVEAQMRWLTKVFPGHFERRAQRVEELEDAVGHAGYTGLMLAAATATGDAKVMTHWQKERAQAQINAEAVLAKRWTPGSKDYEVVKLVRDAAEVKWSKVTRDTLIDAVADECGRVIHSDLDVTDFEQMHGLRRRGRWANLVMQSLDGAVAATDARGLATYVHLTTDPIAATHYAFLPSSPREAEPITVPRTSFIAAAKVVDRLGQIKDQSEALDGIIKALQATRKISKKDAHRLATQLRGMDPQAHETTAAEVAQLYLEARTVFASIRDDVMSQRSKKS